MKRWATTIVCALALTLSAQAQDLVGEWDMKMDYQGNMIDSKMIVKKGDDGALTGVWSSERGESALENVKIDGNKVTFTRTVEVQGQQYELAFEGIIDGNTITGAYDTPMGALDVTGARAGGDAPADDATPGDITPLIGDWNAHVTSALGEFDHVITFAEDGTGVYNGEGATYDITDVKLADNAVTFAMTIDLEGQELPMKFEGTIDGAALNGEFITDFGNGAVTATKAGAASVLAAILGEWDAEVDMQSEVIMAVITFKEDKSGDFKTTDDSYKIYDIDIADSDLKFGMTVDLDGQELKTTFEGKLEGDSIVGEFISDFGNAPMAAKRKASAGGGELAALVDEFLAVLKAQDIEKLMTYYADDFASDQGGGKAEFTEFLNGAKEQGFLEDMGTTIEDMDIAIDGDKASIENVELEGAFGVLTIGLKLEKRDGKWLVTYQSQH